MEKSAGVEPFDPTLSQDRTDIGHTVSADDFLLLPVPDKQVRIMQVEGIDVGLAAGAFAGGSERLLSQPSQFPQHVRDFASLRDIDRKVAVLAQQTLWTQLR